MPIEIRELVVRATIATPQKNATKPAQGPEKDKKASAIRDAIEQMIDINKLKKER